MNFQHVTLRSVRRLVVPVSVVLGLVLCSGCTHPTISSFFKEMKLEKAEIEPAKPAGSEDTVVITSEKIVPVEELTIPEEAVALPEVAVGESVKSAIKPTPLPRVAGDRQKLEQRTQILKREHLRIRDDETVVRLEAYLGQKVELAREVNMLVRFYRERQLELAKANQALADEFSIDIGKSYRYEPDSMTIFEVPSAATPTKKKTVHKKLKKNGSAEQFVRLATMKASALDEMKSLKSLMTKKTNKLLEYQAALTREFACAQGREYEYDQDSRTLFELVRVPVGAEKNGLSFYGKVKKSDKGRN